MGQWKAEEGGEKEWMDSPWKWHLPKACFLAAMIVGVSVSAGLAGSPNTHLSLLFFMSPNASRKCIAGSLWQIYSLKFPSGNGINLGKVTPLLLAGLVPCEI